jgi:hypothetical protein
VTPAERLYELLRSLSAQSFEREVDFISAVIPPLAEILGYSANETFYEHAVGRMRPDVVFAASITSKPWIAIELKGHGGPYVREWDRQIRSYLNALRTMRGLVLSQTVLLVVDAHSAESTRINLQTVTREQAEYLLSILRHDVQAPATQQTASANPLIGLIEVAERAVTNQEKGKSLEAVAQFVLESVPSLRCKYANLYTRSSEIDLVVEYDQSRGGIPLFDELGRYALIECKNWGKPVGVGPVRDFMGKLDKCKARIGIIFARNGITGVDAGVDALREIQSRYDRDGLFVVVFSLEDLRAISNGREFVAALDWKADTLRFDAELP